MSVRSIPLMKETISIRSLRTFPRSPTRPQFFASALALAACLSTSICSTSIRRAMSFALALVGVGGVRGGVRFGVVLHGVLLRIWLGHMKPWFLNIIKR